MKMANKKQLKKNVKKENKFKKVLGAIGRFFNRPTPIIIALCIINLGLLLYIFRVNTRDDILVGSVTHEDVSINNIHYFTNNDMNYFYAMNAHSERKDKVYTYSIGYYTVDEDNNYTEFAVRTGSLGDPLAISDIIGDYSGWNIAELAKKPYHFTAKNKNNINNMHFVFKGSTKKDSTDADIVIDVKVDMTKLTK